MRDLKQIHKKQKNANSVHVESCITWRLSRVLGDELNTKRSDEPEIQTSCELRTIRENSTTKLEEFE